MDELLQISKTIQNLSQVYVKSIEEKDEVLQKLIKQGKDIINIIEEEDSDYSQKDIYILSEFINSLRNTKSFKDVREKDELIYRVFSLIKKLI